MFLYYGNIFDAARFEPYEQMAGYIEERTTEGSTVFLIDHDMLESYHYFISYYDNDRKFEGLEYTELIGLEGLNRDRIKEMAEDASKCDYIYATAVNDLITDGFTDFFGGKELKARTVYKVVNEGGNNILKEIY